MGVAALYPLTPTERCRSELTVVEDFMKDAREVATSNDCSLFFFGRPPPSTEAVEKFLKENNKCLEWGPLGTVTRIATIIIIHVLHQAVNLGIKQQFFDFENNNVTWKPRASARTAKTSFVKVSAQRQVTKQVYDFFTPELMKEMGLNLEFRFSVAENDESGASRRIVWSFRNSLFLENLVVEEGIWKALTNAPKPIVASYDSDLLIIGPDGEMYDPRTVVVWTERLEDGKKVSELEVVEHSLSIVQSLRELQADERFEDMTENGFRIGLATGDTDAGMMIRCGGMTRIDIIKICKDVNFSTDSPVQILRLLAENMTESARKENGFTKEDYDNLTDTYLNFEASKLKQIAYNFNRLITVEMPATYTHPQSERGNDDSPAILASSTFSVLPQVLQAIEILQIQPEESRWDETVGLAKLVFEPKMTSQDYRFQVSQLLGSEKKEFPFRLLFNSLHPHLFSIPLDKLDVKDPIDRMRLAALFHQLPWLKIGLEANWKLLAKIEGLGNLLAAGEQYVEGLSCICKGVVDCIEKNGTSCPSRKSILPIFIEFKRDEVAFPGDDRSKKSTLTMKTLELRLLFSKLLNEPDGLAKEFDTDAVGTELGLVREDSMMDLVDEGEGIEGEDVDEDGMSIEEEERPPTGVTSTALPRIPNPTPIQSKITRANPNERVVFATTKEEKKLISKKIISLKSCRVTKGEVGVDDVINMEIDDDGGTGAESEESEAEDSDLDSEEEEDKPTQQTPEAPFTPAQARKLIRDPYKIHITSARKIFATLPISKKYIPFTIFLLSLVDVKGNFKIKYFLYDIFFTDGIGLPEFIEELTRIDDVGVMFVYMERFASYRLIGTEYAYGLQTFDYTPEHSLDLFKKFLLFLNHPLSTQMVTLPTFDWLRDEIDSVFDVGACDKAWKALDLAAHQNLIQIYFPLYWTKILPDPTKRSLAGIRNWLKSEREIFIKSKESRQFWFYQYHSRLSDEAFKIQDFYKFLRLLLRDRLDLDLSLILDSAELSKIFQADRSTFTESSLWE